MKILLYLVLTLNLINLALADTPFEILGIKGDADTNEVRKAFKKKAIRYLPDALEHKQFRDDGLSVPQKIEKFVELVNAYSELRYKAPAQTPELTVENYREFYFQFFTEDKVCGYNSESKIECETFIKENYPESPFFETNTTNVNMTNIGQFYNRDTIYLVCVYKSAEKYQKGDAMMKTWRKLGNKNKEWFLVWGVDCKLEPEICEVAFDSVNKDFESFAYPINAERKALTGFVTSVPNISGMAMKLITDIEIQELYEPNFHIIATKAARADKKLAVLFTEKHNIPKVWKLLQDKFEETLVLTTVGSSNKKMIEKFEITEYPTLMVLDDPQSISTAITYEGTEFKKEYMAQFLEKHSKQADLYFEEYTQEMVDAGKFCGKDDKFCVIFNLQGDYSLLESVVDVPQQYKKKNIRFLYVKEGFSTELENEAGFVFVKSKRQRYAFVKKSSTSLVQFIDDALESAINFQKMPEDALKNVKTVKKSAEKKEEL